MTGFVDDLASMLGKRVWRKEERMSTSPVVFAVGTGVVVIVLAIAIVLVVLFVTLSMRGRQRRDAQRRDEARRDRDKARGQAGPADPNPDDTRQGGEGLGPGT